MNDVVKECEQKMKQAVEATRHELMTLRTGKAAISFLEPVRVDYYGSKVPLNQVANLSVPDARMIVVSPWDPKQISTIEKAIREANLGFNPSKRWKGCQSSYPCSYRREKKRTLQKAREIGEKGKVAIRHIRHEGRELLEKKKKNKAISEDDKKEGFEKIQKLHDKYIEEIDKSVEKKKPTLWRFRCLLKKNRSSDSWWWKRIKIWWHYAKTSCFCSGSSFNLLQFKLFHL